MLESIFGESARLRRQINALTQSRNETERSKNQLDGQLSGAKSYLANMQADRRSQQMELDRKKQEMDQVTKTVRSIEIDLQIRDIRKQLDNLDDIINSPAPEPIYAYKCVNGIVNCQNHPLDHSGGTFLANGPEIEAHDQSVEQAKARKIGLAQQIYDLDRQYYLLTGSSDIFTNDTLHPSKDQFTWNTLIEMQKFNLRSNQEYFVRVMGEYQSLQNAVSQSDALISQMQAWIDDLNRQIGQKNQDLAEINYRLQNAQTELEEVTDRASQAQQSSDYSGGSFSGPPQNISMGDIERMVMQELASEAGAVRDFGSRVASDVREARQAVRNFAGDVATTIGDLYPSAGVGLLMKAMGQRMDEVAGIPSQEDASGSRNLILEYARQNPR